MLFHLKENNYETTKVPNFFLIKYFKIYIPHKMNTAVIILISAMFKRNQTTDRITYKKRSEVDIKMPIEKKIM